MGVRWGGINVGVRSIRVDKWDFRLVTIYYLSIDGMVWYGRVWYGMVCHVTVGR